MSAPNPDDLSVTALSGQPLIELVNDQTTTVAFRVELRGVAVAVNSGATITLIRSNGAGVSLSSVSVATTGEISAPCTAANITSASASVGDSALLLLEGNVTDGANTLSIRRQIPCVIVSAATCWSMMYAELTARYSQLAKSCALPDGQSTFWPQIQVGLREFRREMHTRFGERHKMLSSESTQSLEIAYALRAVCGNQGGSPLSKTDYWPGQVQYWTAEIDRLWKCVTVLVKDNATFGNVPNTSVAKVESDTYQKRGVPGYPQWVGGSM